MLDFLLNIDIWCFTQINSVFTHSVLDQFFVWVTDLHKTLAFKVIAVPFVLALFIRKYKYDGISLFVIMILSLSASDFIGGRIKHLADRNRPFNNTSLLAVQRSDAGKYSFYSNHSSNMFTFASYTSVFLPPLKIPLFLIAAAVAYSRVYNGVHFPSDVLVGAFMGCLIGVLFSKLAGKFLKYLQNRKRPE